MVLANLLPLYAVHVCKLTADPSTGFNIIIMAVRIAMLAALAVSAQAGYLRDLKEEAAPKNRVVKTFQFPATLLVSERHPAGSHPTLAVPEA